MSLLCRSGWLQNTPRLSGSQVQWIRSGAGKMWNGSWTSDWQAILWPNPWRMGTSALRLWDRLDQQRTGQTIVHHHPLRQWMVPSLYMPDINRNRIDMIRILEPHQVVPILQQASLFGPEKSFKPFVRFQELPYLICILKRFCSISGHREYKAPGWGLVVMVVYPNGKLIAKRKSRATAFFKLGIPYDPGFHHLHYLSFLNRPDIHASIIPCLPATS